MKMKSSTIVAAMAAVTAMAASAYATPIVAGTFVTDPSQVSAAPVAASGTSTGATDAVAMQLANDATNVYVYLTFNSIDYGAYLAIDSDNNASTGDAIYGSPLIGSNLGIQYGTGFTQTASSFNTDPSYYGTGSGTVTPATFGEVTTATTLLYTIPLTTLEADADTGGYNGLVFPTNNFTIEAWQGSGNVLGPVEYSIAAVPEPASLSLLALGAIPMLRRRSKQA